MAGRGLSRRDGLYGPPWPSPRAARRARPRDPERGDGDDGLCAARLGLAGAGLADPGRRRARLRLALRAGPRLSQGRSRPARAAGTAPSGGGRSAGVSGLLRLGAGTRSGARRTRGSGLARQAHPAAQSHPGFQLLPRHAVHQPAAGAGPAGQRSLRQLRALPASLPDRRDHRPLPARCAALHLVPDDRAGRLDTGAAAGSHRQPHLRLRRLPAGVSLEPICAGRQRARFRAPPCAGHCIARRSVRLDCRAVRRPDGRLGDPAHRPRALAAQYRGGAGQRRRAGAGGRARRAADSRDDPSALVREHVRWAIERLHGDPSDGSRAGAYDVGCTGGSCEGGRADGPS